MFSRFIINPMKFFVIFCTIFLQSIVKINAQNKQQEFHLKGTVYDSFTGAGIENAKVYLLNSDSIIVDSTTVKTGDCGKGGTNNFDAIFTFIMSKPKSSHFNIVKICHKDYETVYHKQSYKYVGRQKTLEMPKLYMKRKTSFADRLLNEVEVNATKVQVFYKGDTIVYNADAFNVADGSMLDALIKQMPGVELDKNGQIFVNGKKIDNLLLNGKDFFRGNNKLMLENLPYYTVKDVKVYNKTTDKALALNDDFAKKDFVMDVNLKKEYSKGYVANVEAGVGTEDSYLGRLFGLRFTDYSRFAIVGGTNNLNMRDYSSTGRWSDSGTRDGRTTSKLLSAELLNENKRKKNVLTMEVTHTKTLSGVDEYQETYHSNDISTFSVNRNSYNNKKLNASVNNHFTLKLPLWFESISSLKYEHNKNYGTELYCNSDSDSWHNGKIGILDSLFKAGVSINDPSLHNARNRMNEANVNIYSASQNFALAKNMFTGDILDFNAIVEYIKTESDSYRTNQYLKFSPNYYRENVEETIDNPKSNFGVDANLSYKIKRWLPCADVSFYAKYHYSYNKDKELITDVPTSTKDLFNSYDRNMNGHLYTAGVQYDYNKKNGGNVLKINLNIPFVLNNRNTEYMRYMIDTCLVQTHKFVEPSFSITKEKWPKGAAVNPKFSIALQSSLKFTAPDAIQLITLPVTTDRINVLCGNSNLKPASVWASKLDCYFATKQNMAYVKQNLTYHMYNNRIVNSYSYDGLSGVYTHTPENINGTWDISYHGEGMHFLKIAKHNFTIYWTLNANYNEMSNFVADGISGYTKKINNNELYLSLPLKIRTHIAKRIMVVLYSNIDWRKPLSDNNYASYSDALSYRVGGGLGTEIFAKIDWESELAFTKRSGYVDNNLNKPMYEWDMSFSRSFLKNKLNLKLTAVDILHQYKGIAYMTNEQGIRETHSISLPGYILFSASYRFNHNPKKK